MKPALQTTALAVLMATALTARADYYDGSAALTFTLNSITNSGANPGDLSNLAITASYQSDPNDYYSTSGDGAYTANNPAIAPTALTGNSAAYTYSIGASTLNGSVATATNGYYTLDFNNTGGINSYTVDLTLGYLLKVDAATSPASLAALGGSGGYVNLNYWYTGNYTVESFSSIYGFGSDTVETNSLSSGHLSDSQQLQGSTELVFTLAPGEEEQFFANPSVNGSVTAVATVPVPAAAWLFASAFLGWLGVNRTSRISGLVTPTKHSSTWMPWRWT